MIWALASFSLLVGLLCPLLGSIALVVYFSIAAATAIALLAFFSGSSAGFVFLAWLATIAAIQVGFALSTLMLAMLKLKKKAGTPHFAAQHKKGRQSPVDKDLAAHASKGRQTTPLNHRGALDT